MSGYSMCGPRFQGRTIQDLVRVWNKDGYLSAEELDTLMRRGYITRQDVLARYNRVKAKSKQRRW